MFNRLPAAAALLALMSGAALADAPGADWMAKEPVKAKLQGLGYSSVLLEADDGSWEGLAINKGAIVKIKVDPKTGEVKHERPMTDDDL